MSGASSASSTVRRSGDKENGRQQDAGDKEGADKEGPADGEPVENEDTMKNLRKTFAGIFGDIN